MVYAEMASVDRLVSGTVLDEKDPAILDPAILDTARSV
jgi:hypothetical protein